MATHIAIVGAGLAGLACARELTAAGVAVTLFDKSRGVGGRSSTRRVTLADGTALSFDHGAQYFTVREANFRRLVDRGAAAGMLARWQPRLVKLSPAHPGQPQPLDDDTPRWVGVPGMNALPKLLLAELDRERTTVELHTRIEAIAHDESGWSLTCSAGRRFAGFDGLVVNVPAGQATPLLAGCAPQLAERAASCVGEPCWAVLVRPETPRDLGFDAAFVDAGPLAWVADTGSKPGRPAGPAWVLHSRGEWARAQLETPADSVGRQLLAAWAELVGEPLAPAFVQVHRWRFAKPEPLPELHLFDADRKLGVCGDWCGGPRVEGAVTSGRSLAATLLAGP